MPSFFDSGPPGSFPHTVASNPRSHSRPQYLTYPYPADIVYLSPAPPIVMASGNDPFQMLPDKTISLILQHAATPTITLDPREYPHGPGQRVHPKLHYLGRVSRRWHDISLRNPLVWRHIVCFVDVEHTIETLSTSPLAHYLARSAPLPIHIYLVRKVKVPRTLDLVEGRSVKVLVGAFQHHLERIESLVVETNQASSLPDFQSLLLGSGIARRLAELRSLVLRCNADDSILQLRTHPSRLTSTSRGRCETSTMLTTLHVDGKNLLSMLQSSLSGYWSQERDVFSCMPMLETLGVNNLTFRVDGYSNELIQHFFLDVLPSFPRLHTLALDTFEPIDDGQSWPIHGPDSVYPPVLSPSTSDSIFDTTPATTLLPLSISHLMLKHTKQDSIDFVLKRVTHHQTLILNHCYFNSPSPLHISNCTKLVLVDIPTDCHQVIPKIIAGWQGQELQVVNSPNILDRRCFSV